MRKIKQILALTMATVMVVSTATFAAETLTGGAATVGGGNASGDGTTEVPPETDVLNVELPTVAASTYNFKMDPEGLLVQTSGDAGHTDFSGLSGTMFFYQTSATKYANESDSATITNKSSFDIDVTVKAELVSAAGITMSTTNDFSTATDAAAQVYLAVKDADGETALAAADGKITATVETAISGAATQYETKWDNATGKYTYALKSTATGFDTYTFSLTGACNDEADWGAYDQAPTVNVVWTVCKAGAVAKTETAVSVASWDNLVTWFDLGTTDAITAVSIDTGAGKTDLATSVVGRSDTYGSFDTSTYSSASHATLYVETASTIYVVTLW